MNVTFIKGLYDRDGDLFDDCILLLMGERSNILKVKDTKEIKKLISELKKIAKEIDENY